MYIFTASVCSYRCVHIHTCSFVTSLCDFVISLLAAGPDDIANVNVKFPGLLFLVSQWEFPLQCLQNDFFKCKLLKDSKYFSNSKS